MKKVKRNDLCWCQSGLKYKNCHLHFDEKMKKFKHMGYELPNRELIRNQNQIEGIRESGKINSYLHDYIAEKLQPGITTYEIDQLIYNKTKSLGAYPATLNYNGFSKSLCTSINDQVCHGIPSKEDYLNDGDIINIDLSTSYNGYFSDSARVYSIGNISKEKANLIQVAKGCMLAGVEAVKPWTSLNEVGIATHKYANLHGYSIAKGIDGHGIGLKFHEAPFVSFESYGSDMLMVPGMVFTIEPAVNQGGGDVFEDAANTWTIYTEDGLSSAQWEVTLLVTEQGYEILSN